MSDADSPEESSEDAAEASDGITRRRMVLGGGASIAALGGGRALYNTTLGYGQLGMGTNLLEQDLRPLLTERLFPTYDERIEGTRVRFDGSALVVDEAETARFETEEGTADAAELDESFGLDGRLEALFADLSSVRRGEFSFEFHRPDAFIQRFEEHDRSDGRAEIATAIRGNRDRTVDPTLIEEFAGVDPASVAPLVEGLVEGFREHTNYDVPRYLAGSIEDNVIFGAADLRRHFEEDVGFEALLEADGTGIFCWELVFRSIEAFQSVPPVEQSIPVAACYVSDSRHKHAYTGLLGAIREDGELRFPMTFVDYTHTTLYDDVRLTAVLGEGLAAYDDGHRADEIYW